MNLKTRQCEECGKKFRVLKEKPRMFCWLGCRKTFYMKNKKLKDPEGRIRGSLLSNFNEGKNFPEFETTVNPKAVT